MARMSLSYYAFWPLFALSLSHGCVVGYSEGIAITDPIVVKVYFSA